MKKTIKLKGKKDDMTLFLTVLAEVAKDFKLTLVIKD
tara:strand:- start:3214 stop:3324 length:111 start_codon:yes stop_codon:yes gene_type:complete